MRNQTVPDHILHRGILIPSTSGVALCDSLNLRFMLSNVKICMLLSVGSSRNAYQVSITFSSQLVGRQSRGASTSNGCLSSQVRAAPRLLERDPNGGASRVARTPGTASDLSTSRPRDLTPGSSQHVAGLPAAGGCYAGPPQQTAACL